MRKILVIGAGKSASNLITYLIGKSEHENLHITIGDLTIEHAEHLINGHANATAIVLDIFNETDRKAAVQNADIVISMLPARFHVEVAKDCVAYGKHMVTASYISSEMKALDAKAKANNKLSRLFPTKPKR